MTHKEKWDKLALSYFGDCNHILDIGCGEGRFISLDPKRITGLDKNSKAIEVCEAKGYFVIEMDIFDAGRMAYCGIHCSHLLEHYNPKDVHRILKIIDGILPSGGTLVIRTPLLWTRFYDDLTHTKPYNPEAIMHYLCGGKQHTFKPISDRYKVIHLRYRWKLKYRWRKLEKIGYMLVLRKGG